MRNKSIIAICIIAILCGLGYIYNQNIYPEKQQEIIEEAPKPVTKFGFNTELYTFTSNVIKSNQFLGSILDQYGVSSQTIHALELKSRGIFDVRNLRVGKKYHIVHRDSCDAPCEALVYEAAPLKYVVYDLKDSTNVHVVERPYDMCTEEVSGTITSSLWNTMVSQGINPAVIDLMEDALASQVSFYHTQKGDRFKVIYERKMVDGKEVGLGKMLAAYFANDYGEYYSVFYENEVYGGYYDLEGRPAKKSFLRSPIRAGRISSRYNLRRLHPIKKRRIPHLGTDYAAPYGTNILSVADGVVVEARRKRNNGNYVKIRHDDTYSSQYLHMQRFAKGIKPGVKVTQGQVIGHVGSTGLATGPHVCFRFWKHGKQIDHLRENFPPAEPMPEEELPAFLHLRDSLRQAIDLIPIDTIAVNSPELFPKNS